METKTVKYINVNGKLMDLSHPQVMGILNVTPDSFYAGSRQQTEKDIINRTSQIIEEGASMMAPLFVFGSDLFLFAQNCFCSI